MTPARSIDEILELYERFGTERYDEVVTQLDHALQTAALAVAARAGDELVAAALLHDVGHLLYMRDQGGHEPAGTDAHHEAVGARYLAGLFGPRVTAAVALHVRAKRYLCAVHPGYHDELSPGSVASLAVQGGPLTPEEAAAFEGLPGSAGAVALRGWDDAGKVVGASVPGLDAYDAMLRDISSGSRSRTA